MTKDDIMEMAYEAGIQEAFSLQHDQVLVQFQNGSLERFAAFVAAKAAEKEREACAKTAESLDDWANDPYETATIREIAALIRSRSSEH